MKQELDDLLCKKYPKIFRDRHASIQVSLMPFGFDCGDGWFNIIHNLCGVIQNHVDHSRRARARALIYNRALKRALNGDTKSLERYYSRDGALSTRGKEFVEQDIAAAKFHDVPVACRQVIAVQVKEKFGSLRFYIDGGDDYVRGAINFAEWMSSTTCEACGSEGKIYTDGWYKALCKQHARELGRFSENDDDNEI